MKIVIKCISILLFAVPVVSYSMNSANAVLDFDWLSVLRLGLHSVRQRNCNNRLVPLPPLGSRLIGQSHIQALPPELVGHISSYLGRADRNNLALTSRLQRAQVQSNITHLAIPLLDITPERLQDVQTKFPLVKSLKVGGSLHHISPEKIALLAKTFPNIQVLDLAQVCIALEGVRVLSLPGMFTSLKELSLRSYQDIEMKKVIRYLSQAPFAQKLKSLNLRETPIAAEDVRVLSLPGLFTSLKELNISCNLGIKDEGIRYLSEASFVGQLESLDVSCTGITAEGIRFLSQPGLFKSLKKLYLNFNSQIQDAGISYLSEAPFADQLKVLNLSRTGVTVEGIRALSQQGVFTSLKELDLSSNLRIDDEAIGYLSQAPFARQLELLNLGDTNITTQGMRILSSLDVFNSLKVLDISFNSGIKDEGMGYLSQAPFAGKLESLNLCYTRITTDAVRILSQPELFKFLRELNLEDLRIDDEAISYLSQAPFAGKLESLNLHHTGIKVEGVRILSLPKKFTSLKVLNLSRNFGVKDEGIDYLSKAPFAGQLEILNIENTGITGERVQTMLQSGLFTSLKKIDLSYSQQKID